MQSMPCHVSRSEEHATVATCRPELRPSQCAAPLLRLHYGCPIDHTFGVRRIASLIDPMLIHNRMYVDGLSKYGVLEQILQEPAQYAGIVAGLSMLMIAVTAVGFVRRRQYEVFYAAHIVLVAIVLVAGECLHICSRRSMTLMTNSRPAPPRHRTQGTHHHNRSSSHVVHR